MILLYINLLINNSNAEENIIFEWDTTPDVIICSNSNLKIDQVKEGFDYMMHEHDISFNQEIKYSYGFCFSKLTRNNTDPNTIYITDFEENELFYAVTTTNWNKDKSVYNSFLEIPNETTAKNKKMLLYHEIGHNLGLGHMDHDSIMKAKGF